MLKFMCTYGSPGRHALASAALVLASLLPNTAFSQEPVLAPSGPYRIGLMCVEVPEIVRPHLSIPPDQGMLVEEIVAGSPAQQAGILRHDVLVSVDGKPIHGTAELVQAVQASGGNPVRLVLMRGGEEIVVQVTPVSEPHAPGPLGGGPEALDRLRDVLKYRPHPLKPGDLFLRRGPIFFLGNGPFPANVDVQIHSDAEGKVELVVKRDGQEWKLTPPDAAAQLEHLPEDIRPTIDQLAHGLGVIQVAPEVRPLEGSAHAKAMEDAARAFRKAIPQIADPNFEVHWADPNLPPEAFSDMSNQLKQLEQQLTEQGERLKQLEQQLHRVAPPQPLPPPETPAPPSPVEPPSSSGSSKL